MSKSIFVGLGVATLVFGLSFGRQIQQTQKVQYENLLSESDFLEAVFYEQFFRLVITASDNSTLQTKLGIDDSESSFLRLVAQQCLLEIAKQDAKAKPVIDEFREKAGRVKHKEGLPAPPETLRDLQRGRNAISIRCRETLRKKLGEVKFGQVDHNARAILKINVLSGPTRSKP